MRYTLKLRDIVIGWSDLELRDATRGIASGAFRPGLGYELVEPIFVLRPVNDAEPNAAERGARYRRARDTLELSLHAADGALVDSARIDIVASEASVTALALQVSVVDRNFW